LKTESCVKRRKPALTRGLNQNYDRRLRRVFKSAATSGTRQGPFKPFHEQLLAKGLRPDLAKLTLARKIAAIRLIKVGVSEVACLVDFGVRLDLVVDSLRHLNLEIRQEQVLQQVISAESHLLFNLSEGRLLRTTLLRFGETDHALVTVVHHIITDWWSFDLLWRELTTLYKAFSEGRPSPLTELPVQYADFALWQRHWLSDEVLESRLSYWKKQLAGAEFILELPADRPRPPMQTYNGRRQYLEPPEHLWYGLRRLCLEEKTTLYMTLLAAFYTLLHRYTGRDDVIVGSPYANRSMFETDGLIGYLLNHLVLRTDLSGDPTFRELLRRVTYLYSPTWNAARAPAKRLYGAR